MSDISPAAVIRNILRVLTPLTVILTFYIYLYPVFSSCGFPLPPSPESRTQDDGAAAFVETARLHYPDLVDFVTRNRSENATGPAPRPLAPFRLLTLGDPQLEGDTSIPDVYIGFFPHLRSFFEHITFQSSHWSFRQRIRWTIHDFLDIFLEDIFNSLESIRKRIDLFGNDFYLAHIYRTLHWWARPTHVTVLGDLVGSQWLPDDEFERRGVRFWKRVFRGGERVPDELAREPADSYDLAGLLGPESKWDNETDAWTRRIINIAGNHDIGYAGDITVERMERFERIFGKANYELRFELPVLDPILNATIIDHELNPDSDRLTPELRIIVLNDMNLDTPATDIEMQDATYAFINSVIGTSSAVEYQGHFTVVLTHVPLYKPEGVCVDAPFFDFHEHDGSLKEQNQLSADASRGFLEGIFGMSGNLGAPAGGRGRPGVILNGHDHAGCDTWHYINQSDERPLEEREWETVRWRAARNASLPGSFDAPGIREITVRSMMGDFGGNAGLLSVWFDEETWTWKYEFATCPLGRQHLWWLAHSLVFSTIVLAAAYLVIIILTALGIDADGWIVQVTSQAGRWLFDRTMEAVRGTSVGRRLLDLIQQRSATRSDGDAKKSDGDAKKSDGDAKKSDGDAKKSGGDVKNSNGAASESLPAAPAKKTKDVT